MMPSLYLAGPMTGLPDYNRPAFNAAAAALRSAGYHVTNPVDNGLSADAPWAMHMARDIAMLCGCGAVAFLPGIEDSKGGQLEIQIAKALDMQVYSVELWLDLA